MKHKIVNFRADRITGWFHNPQEKGKRSTLNLFVDGDLVNQLECKIFRNELDPGEFSNRNIGFMGTLPPQFWTGGKHSVSLADASTGAVLHQAEIETPDLRAPGTGDLSGEFQLTDRGQLGGWASQGAQHAKVLVLIDGEQVSADQAKQQQLPWKDSGISVSTPVGYAFAYQIPADYFDDDVHEVQVIVEGASSSVSILEQNVVLESTLRSAAAQAAELLATGKLDWFAAWQKEAKVREDIRVESLSVTSRFAAVTLLGAPQNQQITLRLGKSVVTLGTVTGGREEQLPDDLEVGRQRYAAVIPTTKSFAGTLPLKSNGIGLGASYDLRLGDERGKRPQDLPEEITEDTQGRFLVSEVKLEAATFEGWAFQTAELTSDPVQVLLTEVTSLGEEEVARVTAESRSRVTQKRYGPTHAGYSLPLPTSALKRRRTHLKLQAIHGSQKHLLWEDEQFYPDDAFLHAQVLGSSSRYKVLGLFNRARAAGRKDFAEAFLGTYKYSRANIRLKDIEQSLVAREETEATGLQLASGAIWHWVQEIRNNPGRINWFTQNAIRNRLGSARDILAYCATKGALNFVQLHGILESYRAPLFRDGANATLEQSRWRTAMLALARFLYASPRDETDLLDALTLYRVVEESRSLQVITGMDRAFYGDLLRWRGEFDESFRVLDEKDPSSDQDYSQSLLALNSINPNIARNSGSSDAWLVGLNLLLEAGGAGPIELSGGEVSFFNLSSELPPVQEEPGAALVSVIMPIYEPSAATDVAVDSLLKQTWKNIEIIMVDDCSPAVDDEGSPTGYREQLEALASRDSRIRLVFQEKNRGAYSVRNEGLDLAQGDFVTIADKDDWHHPQQIETQVRHLLQYPDLVANETNWTRVNEDLSVLLRSATGRVYYPSMPSLMFRRKQILEDLGYWDTVRKSGDSEFKSRIENYYGIKLEPVIQAPLAFALMEGANLTKDDMGVGYLAPDRRSYLRSYKRWHRAIREGEAAPLMPKAPQQRPFVAPKMYLPKYDKTKTDQYDVVFASEFGFVAGNSTSLFTEISICLEAGLRVAVLPFQNGLIPSAAKRQFNKKIDELVLSGQVGRVSLDTQIETELLICRWPTALQIIPDTASKIAAQRVVIVANHPPFEPAGRRSYDIGVVTRNVERLFGVRPTWSPQSEQIGAMLQPLMPAADLEDFSWKGIISTEGKPRHEPDFSGTPTIGRHGRDDPAKWPSDRQTFRKVYPIDGSTKVCILGGAKTPVRLGFMPREPRDWEVYAFNEIPVEEYLSEKLDFFVYFHSDGWVEAFGMVILEAMTYGVVCILPKHFRPVFGDAAVYAEAEAVPALLKEMWNPERYADQQAKASRFVEEFCTPEAYLRRIEILGAKLQSNRSRPA